MMTFKSLKKVILNLLPIWCLTTGTSVAGTMGGPFFNNFGPYVATLTFGPAWDTAGESQTFYVAPNIQKTYAPSTHSSSFAYGELFLGLDRMLNERTEGQVGVALAMTSPTKLTGAIWDDANSEFDGLNYSYKVQHSHVAFKGKLLFEVNNNPIKPYVSGSLGVGYNQAQDFNNYAVIFAAIPNPNFTDGRTSSLTYSLGVGLQGPFSRHWQLGVGYEFADWGKSQLNAAPEQTMGSGLSLGHLYTNGLMISLTFIT